MEACGDRQDDRAYLTMVSISSTVVATPGIPGYLQKALDRYQNAATDHARATIRLALSAISYYEEYVVSFHGNVPSGTTAKGFVLNVLTKELPTPFEKSFACRLFAVSELCQHVEQAGLTMDRIRSQGALFALVALVRRAMEKRLSIDLATAVDDASRLTIAEFRRKWRHILQTETVAPAPSELAQVLQWISQARDRNALRKVAAATYQRLAVVANSQRSSMGRTTG